MALSVGYLGRSSLKLLSNNAIKQLVLNASRQLYTPASMGMSGYLNARDYVKSQFHNIDHMFYDKMRDFVENKKDSMIFTEDLKTMLHIVEKKPDDLVLLLKMLKKYKSQNNLRFGSFIFGTVVMRTFYYLDEPDIALETFMDPELEGFFDQIMSHQLLMDLLYNHQRYDDVKAVYNVTKSRNMKGTVHPKNPFILVMASCYQQNTPESFDYAKSLFREAQSIGLEFPRRSISYLGALALKQSDPSTALEVAAAARNMRYIDIRCIKIAAYAQLKRVDEIMVYFRQSLNNDGETRRKMCYFQDTIEEIEKYFKEDNFDENTEVVKMLNQLKLHDYIQTGTLHEHITTTIDSVKFVGQAWQTNKFEPENFMQNKNKNRFGYTKARYPSREYSKFPQQEGLRDRA